MVRNRMQQQITEAKEAQKRITTNDHLIEKYCKAETGEWRNRCCESYILSQVQQYAPDDDEIKKLLHNLEEEVQ